MCFPGEFYGKEFPRPYTRTLCLFRVGSHAVPREGMPGGRYLHLLVFGLILPLRSYWVFCQLSWGQFIFVFRVKKKHQPPMGIHELLVFVHVRGAVFLTDGTRL